jgi:hypothetical protein
MKKSLLFAILFLSVCSFAQNMRVGPLPFPSVSSTAPPFLVANLPPNSPVLSVCHHPANQVPCTNKATTFDSLGNACPNGAQDTPDPNPSACQSTGDALGNIAFWVPAGTYDITVCIQNNCGNSPYTISVSGATANPVYTISVNGAALTAGDTVNFNASSPAAPTNGVNVTFAKNTSGITDSVSAALIGDGISTHCLFGTGVFNTCVTTPGMQINQIAIASVGPSIITASYPYLAPASGPGAIVQGYTNSGTTTFGLIVKLVGNNTVATVGTSDTEALGMCAAQCGVGNSEIAITGDAPCTFDNSATAGHYVQISNSVAGNCHDAGASVPSSGSIILGRVVDGGSAGFHNVAIALTPPAATGGGTVTGSGTTGTLPIWSGSTALGNSLVSQIADSGTDVKLSPTGQSGVLVTPVSPTACGIGGAPTIPTSLQASGGNGCAGLSLAYNPNASPSIGVTAGLQVQNILNTATNSEMEGIVGIAGPQTGTTSLAVGIEGDVLPQGSGSTITHNVGVLGYARIQSNTTATQEGGYFNTEVVHGTVTNNYGLHVASPILGASSVLTHNYGLFVEDPSVAGAGTNSDPHGIHQAGNAPNEFQGHLNQVASGNWAGTCSMSSSTSCTITLTTAYTGTPGCIVTVQSASVIAGGCTVSGTTVTITAASSNSSTWAALLFGNPN